MSSEPDDTAVFTRVYETHHGAVYAYFVGRTSDAEAPDLLQETFLRVWRRLREIRDLTPTRQRAWIFTVARNLTIDTYRGRATRTAVATQLSAATSDADGPEVVLLSAERITALNTAIRQLPEPLRVVVAMHAMSELTSAEIAAALDIPAGTVRYRLSLARKQLSAALAATG